MELTLRDILELAKEFRCRRVRVGDIEVEMPLEPAAPRDFGDERPRLPTELQIREAGEVPRTVPRGYDRAFGGPLPTFESMQKGIK